MHNTTPRLQKQIYNTTPRLCQNKTPCIILHPDSAKTNLYYYTKTLQKQNKFITLHPDSAKTKQHAQYYTQTAKTNQHAQYYTQTAKTKQIFIILFRLCKNKTNL